MPVRNSSKINEDLGLLFTYLSTITGAWIFLLLYIVETSKTEPSSYDLFFLAIAHYLLFLLLIINLLLIFIAGLESISLSSKIIKLLITQKEDLRLFLYSLWLPVLILCAILYAFNHILSYSFKSFYSYATIIALVGLILILISLKVLRKGFKSIKPTDILSYTLLAILGFPYGVIMSVIFCDIEIKADKDIYEPTEKAYIIVKAKGYVFNPFVKEVQFGFKAIASDTAQLINGVEIDIDKYNDIRNFGTPIYLSIIYRDQLTSIIRTKYFPIYVKPKLAPSP